MVEPKSPEFKNQEKGRAIKQKIMNSIEIILYCFLILDIRYKTVYIMHPKKTIILRVKSSLRIRLMENTIIAKNIEKNRVPLRNLCSRENRFE